MEYNYKLKYLNFIGGSEETNCIICLKTFKDNKITTPCGHFFHKKCLNEWVRRQKNCPMCRNDLKQFILDNGCNKCFQLFYKNSDYLYLDCCNTNIHYNCLQKLYDNEYKSCNNCESDLTNVVKKYHCLYCTGSFDMDTDIIVDENGNKNIVVDLIDGYTLPCCKMNIHTFCISNMLNNCLHCNSDLTDFIKEYSCKYCTKFFNYDNNTFEIYSKIVILPCCKFSIHNWCVKKICLNCNEDITPFFIEIQKFNIINKYSTRAKMEIDRLREIQKIGFTIPNDEIEEAIKLINLDKERDIKNELNILINSN